MLLEIELLWLSLIHIGSNQSYTIEYQKAAGEPVETNWTTISNGGTVSGIAHGETVYARLTDGTNHGQYASVRCV